jgi:hypothetical protein
MQAGSLRYEDGHSVFQPSSRAAAWRSHCRRKHIHCRDCHVARNHRRQTATACEDSVRGSLIGKKPLACFASVTMSRKKKFFSPAKAVRELGLPQRAAQKALADAVEWYQRNGTAESQQAPSHLFVRKALLQKYVTERLRLNLFGQPLQNSIENGACERIRLLRLGQTGRFLFTGIAKSPRIEAQVARRIEHRLE